MTGVLCAIAGSGGSIYAGSATVTVGTYSPGSSTNYYGFVNILGGSISPVNWSNSGLPFYFLYWSTNNFIVFEVTGLAPNSGWSTMNIAGTDYSRSTASYSYSSSNNRTQWLWTSITANPFGTTIGATKAAAWS